MNPSEAQKKDGYRYSEEFFDFVEISAGRSAHHFVGRLDLGFEVGSVLDVGCARGIWLDAWARRGVQDIFGLDGVHVKPASLLIPAAKFQPTDISKPFQLDRKFDLVECLEVGEHIPISCARTLVENLVRHGDVVLFSAATPGQGGEFHVNEQPLEYWAALFAEFGYRAFDYPRLAVRDELEVEPWYRYNAVLYASAQGLARLSANVSQHEVPAGTRFVNRASIGWRARCLALRALPPQFIASLAQWKHKIVVTLAK
jgi:SAM-dependent methyltransferase